MFFFLSGITAPRVLLLPAKKNFFWSLSDIQVQQGNRNIDHTSTFCLLGLSLALLLFKHELLILFFLFSLLVTKEKVSDIILQGGVRER